MAQDSTEFLIHLDLYRALMDRCYLLGRRQRKRRRLYRPQIQWGPH